ncbi:hypothetical protein [Mesorhizobium sp. Z1-4]|uniref:hypothetical protein n=1 Tax=Mesorhizobium sp. Z1-4 TaxID=2448478 RepID=UPI000FD706B2|nr:hypothetical protein [Mesorhizobium sp. Z1-4]
MPDHPLMLDPNALAAGLAASAAYGTREPRPTVDTGFVGGGDLSLDRMNTAAAFVRGNPDAPAGAIPIELKLKGFRDLPEQGLREMAAWDVFAFTLKRLDALDAEIDRRREQAEREAKPPQRPVAHGKLAMTPAEPPFSPSGFSPRH